MIREICKWIVPCDWIPFNAFAALEVKTNKLVEYPNVLINDTTFYPVVESYEPRPYQKCVNLIFVDSCITETDDDLEKYGFKMVGYDIRGKLWNR